MSSLSSRLLEWFESSGRHDLPWQQRPSAYRIWVSEVMLQQTQVGTVIPYFDRFVTRFPQLADLAAANIDEVLHLWSGLGYYARGRNLHRCAQIVSHDHAGEFPNDIDALIALPGIGRSTAAAILALAYDERHAILDGNVKRVLARYHEIEGWTGKSEVLKTLWRYAESHTPAERVGDYTQAIMDLGATVCVRSKPRCDICPLTETCAAFIAGTQARYPNPRKRKALPDKAATFLLVRSRDDNTVLLWRRPPTGIWGGLWSFPEIDCATDIPSWCDAHGLAQIGRVKSYPPLQHTFTHFRLTISPLEIAVEHCGTQIMDSDRWLWYNSDAPPTIGVAKPVAKLLKASK